MPSLRPAIHRPMIAYVSSPLYALLDSWALYHTSVLYNDVYVYTILYRGRSRMGRPTQNVLTEVR